MVNVKTAALAVALFALILLGCAVPQPVPPTPRPVIVRSVYTVYLPSVLSSPVPVKGIAGYNSNGSDNSLWRAIGIGRHYNWNHLCPAAELSDSQFPCVNSVRSKAGQVYWLYDDDGCGAYSQAELQACVTSKAAQFPDAAWLIGNEPDGADPAYSDHLTPTEAADYYGQIYAAIRAGSARAPVACCGFVLPINMTTYADEFATAWQAHWGTPFGAVGGFAFHIYSVIGSSCALSDAACLQAAFDAQLTAGTSFAAAHGFARSSVTEWGWTPFDSQQTIALNAARIPAMCASLRGAGVDYYIYHAPAPSPFALLNVPAPYPMQDNTPNAAGIAYQGC